MWNFSKQKALVTGGANGIGLAITQMLHNAGAEVHVFDLSKNEETNAPGIFHCVDISNSASVQSAVKTLPVDLGLLVNNAGIIRDRTLAKMSDEEWQSVIDINLNGAFYLIRALAPRMRARQHGRIVNITSINGMRGKFGQANYTAAKAGLIGLTKTAARELGSTGITVNAVAPGMVMTEMAGKLPQEYLQKALDETVLKVLAEPEDIANAVLFLLSDAARMISGEVIKVDSGQYL
jgi:NAD(P)-dependent dehydrogenase (short-subunit alcohol dehydrogenase family)